MGDGQEYSPEQISLKSTLQESDHSSSAEHVSPNPSEHVHIASPLQQSFPSSPMTSELETSSNEAVPVQVNYEKSEARGRGMSRSSSVPAGMNTATKSTVNSTSSVRHMTCFWWKEKGHCSKPDDDCAYAHYDTGLYTRAPQHLFPGERALAGRKLERAQRSLAVQYVHRSSGSLPSLAGSRHGSRPSTPNMDASGSRETIEHQISTGPARATRRQFLYPGEAGRIISTPSPTEVDFARLGHDNELLKTLVEQNSKEKAILIGTIESLQANSKSMNAELEGLRLAQVQLLAEREGLHSRLGQLDHQQVQMPTRSVSHPFGPIGRARVNTETRYLGGLLDNE